MKQKTTATILLVLGVLIILTTSAIKIREDILIQKVIQSMDSCYTKDGTCLHDRSNLWYMVVWFIGGTIAAVGWLMRRSEKDLQEMSESQLKITEELKKAKQVEREKDEFKAFLSAFNDEEKSILEQIHTQEGITQSTLRYRTGLSKAKLSLILKDLEKRDIVSKMPHKKTNKLYLKKMSI